MLSFLSLLLFIPIKLLCHELSLPSFFFMANLGLVDGILTVTGKVTYLHELKLSGLGK